MRTVLAIGAHPDDIEFMMAGTLILLKQKGYDVHLHTIGNGSCGTDKLSKEEIITIRQKESENAAKVIDGTYHPALVDDLEIFYEKELLKKVTDLIRRIKPEIILTHFPQDYMEDHQNTCRLVTTAAFCRGMKNFKTLIEPYISDIFLYHCLPYGLKDGLRNLIIPDEYVNISSVIELKEKMLTEHKSQKEWLDVSQGINSYVNIMLEMCKNIALMSEKDWKYAEGWKRHLHLGLSANDEDRLKEVLKDSVC